MSKWTFDKTFGAYVILDVGLAADGDGSNGQTGGIACYVPKGSELPSLDNLANAGHPGDWWGLSCDDQGEPYIQKSTDPAPGAYISTTAYQFKGKALNDPNRYLDAASVPFIVVPGSFVRGVLGVVLGCKCAVVNYATGLAVAGMAGDVGPAFGEFSLALCRRFDPNATCHGTAISRGMNIYVYPGQQFDPAYPLQPS